MLFPEFRNKRSQCINLNNYAIAWLKKNGVDPSGPNPLLDPSVCQSMICEFHEMMRVDYSYGGWMENRAVIWRGTYLDATGNYLHLGVDFNVPAGTLVTTSDDAAVLLIDTDVPEKEGWGTRVVLRPKGDRQVLIYGHLSPEVRCSVGDKLQRDFVFASIGEAPANGGWFPHLHVQCMGYDAFKELQEMNRLSELDGYGHPDQKAILAERFPDPLWHLDLAA